MATTDGGTSWTGYQFPDTIPVSVSFADTAHGWMVDNNGYLYRTTDGGANWMRTGAP
jgi:photosystem II stability/assembly factor-like uncharacterized protein